MVRIIVIGQAAFGAGVLEGLLARSEEIVAVYAPPDNPGRAVDALKSIALDHAIPIFQPETYKDERVFADYCSLKPDLTILAFVPRIIPVRYLEWPTHDSICFHPSLLPRHRGASAINCFDRCQDFSGTLISSRAILYIEICQKVRFADRSSQSNNRKNGIGVIKFQPV